MAVAELDKLRQKYPQYADIDDVTLATRIAAKYPQYSDLADKAKASQSTVGQQLGYGSQASPILNALGGTAAGVIHQFNPNFPSQQEYQQASQELQTAAPAPQGVMQNLARGAGKYGPDVAASIPAFKFAELGLQGAARIPQLAGAAGVLTAAPTVAGVGAAGYTGSEALLSGATPTEALKTAGESGLASAATVGALQGAGALAGKAIPKVGQMLTAGKALKGVNEEIAKAAGVPESTNIALADAKELVRYNKKSSLSDMTDNFKAANQTLNEELSKEKLLQSGANKAKLNEVFKNMTSTYRVGLDKAEDALAAQGTVVMPVDYKKVVDQTVDELRARFIPEDSPAFIKLKNLQKDLGEKDIVKAEDLGVDRDIDTLHGAIRQNGGIAPYKKGMPGGLGEEYRENVPINLRNSKGMDLSKMAQSLAENYPQLGITSESDLLDALSHKGMATVAGKGGQMEIDMTKPLNLTELRNFKNKIYDTLSSGVKSGNKYSGIDDQVANVFLRNHGSFIGELSPELKQLNVEFAPMANARAWAMKTFKPYNVNDIQRGANVLENIATGKNPNQTNINYLKQLEEGSGSFQGAGDLTGRTGAIGKGIKDLKQSFDLAKKNLVDSTDYRLHQLAVLGSKQGELKDLIKTRNWIAGITLGAAAAKVFNAGKLAKTILDL
jgi:hypothetical protein